MDDQPSLRQLRYFLAVAEERHFGRAAEREGIAQPPLTQQIQKLERILGCQLIIRGRKTELTAAGETLAAEARRLLDLAAQATERTRSVARGETGQLTVGVPPSVMLTRLPAAVRRYRQQYPAVMLTLKEMATSRIEDALRAGEVDLGFLRESAPGAPLASAPFLEENVVAVLPASHRFATSRAFQVRQLRNEPFVLFPARLGPNFHARLIAPCIAAGFSPNIVQEATQWQTILSLVEAGMGVSLAPACVTKFPRAALVYRAIPNATTTVHACWRANDLGPAANRFLTLARR